MKNSNNLDHFVPDEFGTASIEYGLIAFLVSILIVSALTAVGVILAGIYPSIGAALAAAI